MAKIKIKRYSKTKEAFKSIFRFLGRNIITIAVVFSLAALVVFSFAWATESEANSLITDSPIDETTEKSLTSSEVDKIIQDLKATGNIDNALDKLDEIAKRSELVGNTAVKEYALQMKSVYELQKQLDSAKSMVNAMKKKNTEIEELDKEIQRMLSVTTLVEDLRGGVSDETLVILESLTQEQLGELNDLIVEIEDTFDINNIFSMSINQRALLDTMILTTLIEKKLLDSDVKISLAKDALSVAVTILKSYEKQTYTPETFVSMQTASDKFASSGKKARAVSAEQVVLFNSVFKLRKTPIMYDSQILAPIEDLFQFVDAKIEYMYDSANMVIQSENKVLEITAGKNIAYLNDIPMSMSTPVISFDKTLYMPIESFAQAYNISYRVILEHEVVILFKNLTQLKNPSVANKLNKG